MIVIDTRWIGAHGIGRYAAEVVPRLMVRWERANFRGNPVHWTAPGRAWARNARRPRSDVVYSPGYNAAPGSRIRQIVTVHDLIHLSTNGLAYRKYAAYYNAILRPAIRRAGVVLTVSNTSAHLIREWIADDSVRIINAGIGCSEAFEENGDSWSEAPYLLFVGNCRAHKNIETVLASLRLIPEARLVCVVPDVDRAKQLAFRHGVLDRTSILSGLSDRDLAQVYRGAAATLVPSAVEGFGLPALESIACGTPVIFWNGCGSVREIVAASGFALGSLTDLDEWSNAMRAAIATAPAPILRSVLDEYDWARTADIVGEVLFEEHGNGN